MCTCVSCLTVFVEHSPDSTLFASHVTLTEAPCVQSYSKLFFFLLINSYLYYIITQLTTNIHRYL